MSFFFAARCATINSSRRSSTTSLRSLIFNNYYSSSTSSSISSTSVLNTASCENKSRIRLTPMSTRYESDDKFDQVWYDWWSSSGFFRPKSDTEQQQQQQRQSSSHYSPMLMDREHVNNHHTFAVERSSACKIWHTVSEPECGRYIR